MRNLTLDCKKKFLWTNYFFGGVSELHLKQWKGILSQIKLVYTFAICGAHYKSEKMETIKGCHHGKSQCFSLSMCDIEDILISAFLLRILSKLTERFVANMLLLDIIYKTQVKYCQRFKIEVFLSLCSRSDWPWPKFPTQQQTMSGWQELYQLCVAV